MSQENVEIVQRMYDRWERGELATPEFFDPAIEFARIGSEFADLAGEWRGLDQMWTATADWLRAWEDLRISAERFVDIDDERVLVFDRYTGRGRTSGLAVEHGAGWVFTLRHGKIVRAAAYWDRSQALEAAGLSE